MIQVKNLSKEFRVFKRRIGYLKYFCGMAVEGKDYDIVRSLNNINLEVAKGKVHGIIGMNGAGKSTFLKILTGVLSPSTGNLEMGGRVSSLLELGTGFHNEMTGRENVFYNAALLGLSREDIDRKIPEILHFSELADFFDRPVKIYSSGMYVRLAFAFAISVDPDVLIIDEALSVGDAYFQQKCLRKIREFRDRGVTILFVSHDLGVIRILCDAVTLLSHGELVYTGKPVDALDLYNALLAESRSQELVRKRVQQINNIDFDASFLSGNLAIEVVKTSLLNEKGSSVSAVVSGECVLIKIEAKVNVDTLLDPTCGILFKDRLGYDVFGTNSYYLGKKSGELKKGDLVSYEFKCPLNLGAGDYTLSIALHSDNNHVADSYHWIDRALIVKVLPSIDFEFIGVARLEPQVQIHCH